MWFNKLIPSFIFIEYIYKLYTIYCPYIYTLWYIYVNFVCIIGIFTFTNYLLNLLGTEFLFLFAVVNFYLSKKYNLHILLDLKKAKESLFSLIQVVFIILSLKDVNIFYSLSLVIVILIFCYINYINSRFKYEYTYLYLLINIIIILLMVILVSLVFIKPSNCSSSGEAGGSGNGSPGKPGGQGGPKKNPPMSPEAKRAKKAKKAKDNRERLFLRVKAEEDKEKAIIEEERRLLKIKLSKTEYGVKQKQRMNELSLEDRMREIHDRYTYKKEGCMDKQIEIREAKALCELDKAAIIGQKFDDLAFWKWRLDYYTKAKSGVLYNYENYTHRNNNKPKVVVKEINYSKKMINELDYLIEQDINWWIILYLAPRALKRK